MIDYDDRQRWQLLAIGVVFEGGLAGLAWFLGWLLDRPAFQGLEWTVKALLQGTVACGPLLLFFLFLVHSNLGAFRQLRQVVDEVIRPLFVRSGVLELAIISLLAGLGEELLFRGVIQSALGDWLGMGMGLILASVLFGLLHPITPMYAIIATLFGVYLGWLWLATGNLLVAMVAHALYDFLVLLYLLHWQTPGDGVRAES